MQTNEEKGYNLLQNSAQQTTKCCTKFNQTLNTLLRLICSQASIQSEWYRDHEKIINQSCTTTCELLNTFWREINAHTALHAFIMNKEMNMSSFEVIESFISSVPMLKHIFSGTDLMQVMTQSRNVIQEHLWSMCTVAQEMFRHPNVLQIMKIIGNQHGSFPSDIADKILKKCDDPQVQQAFAKLAEGMKIQSDGGDTQGFDDLRKIFEEMLVSGDGNRFNNFLQNEQFQQLTMEISRHLAQNNQQDPLDAIFSIIGQPGIHESLCNFIRTFKK